jgi:hypothetical protein
VDRRAALIGGALVAGALVAGAALAKPKESAPRQPQALRLRGIDLGHRLVLIQVDGFPKPPAANLFTMTDERERHFIAQTVHCDPPLPSGTRDCELEIPDGYERHPMVSLELHLRGLHSRTIAIAPKDIAAAWSAAVEAHGPAAGGEPARDGGAAPAARDAATEATPSTP